MSIMLHLKLYSFFFNLKFYLIWFYFVVMLIYHCIIVHEVEVPAAYAAKKLQKLL